MPRSRYDEDDEDDRPRRRSRRDEDDEDDRPRRRSRRGDDEDDFDRPKKTGSGKTLLIVFGILAGVFLVCGLPLAIGLLLPAVQKVREAASRAQTLNNMKQVALGAYNHQDSQGQFPAPFVNPPGGTLPPQDQLSWRAALLPYIEQDQLYKQLQLDQPWNSPANSGPTNTAVKTYGDPLDPPGPTTRFRLFTDNGAAFRSDPRARTTTAGLTDGQANVILYVESADVVPWAQSNDFRFDPTGPLPPLGHPKRNVFAVAMADGSVKYVSKSIDPEVLKRCIRANDGQGRGTDLD